MKISIMKIILVFTLTGCGDMAKPLFHRGQIVQTAVGNNIGQIIGTYCNAKWCSYEVRFNALSITTNTHLFESDDPITFSPINVVKGIREFELKEYLP